MVTGKSGFLAARDGHLEETGALATAEGTLLGKNWALGDFLTLSRGFFCIVGRWGDAHLGPEAASLFFLPGQVACFGEGGGQQGQKGQVTIRPGGSHIL